MENTGGFRRPDETSRFKRLKRAEKSDDEGENARARGLTDMFSEEDEAENGSFEREPAGRTLANEFDDFIEEDEFSDDEIRRQEEAEIRSRPSKNRGPAALSTELTGIDEEKLGEIYEVFGDGEEYEWALDGEDELDFQEEEKASAPELKDVFEPSELKARLLTDEDNSIRAKDLPERYQLLRSILKNDYDLTEDEFSEEQRWIAEKIVLEKITFLSAKPRLREPLEVAVAKVLEFVARDSLEVPFIWQHRRDYLVHRHDPNVNSEDQKNTEDAAYVPKLSVIVEPLLNRDDLWRIVFLDIEFHGMLEKRGTLKNIYNSLGVNDDLYEELFIKASTLVDYQDLMDYIQFRYSEKIKDSLVGDGAKRHSRFGRFERIRSSELYNLVRAFGITAQQLGESIEADQRLYFAEDPAELPEEFAARYSYPDPETGIAVYANATQALEAAQSMLAEEIFYNPNVRKSIRKEFLSNAKIDIVLTDKGSKKIDEGSPFYDFKYAINRTFEELRLRPELYLRMLLAESEGLVDVRVSYPDYKTTLFEKILTRYFASDNVSDIAASWNDTRRSILKAASRKFVPLICRNIREDLKTDCTKTLFYAVRKEFGERLDQSPYKPPGYVTGTTARVLAVSGGMSEFPRDAVVAVLLDEDGNVVEHLKLPEPRQPGFKAAIVDVVKRKSPDVIGVSGFTVNSTKLFDALTEIVRDEELTPGGDAGSIPIEVIWVDDEVARLYQNSARAESEFAEQAPLGRYCVGLARYLQSPLLEFAALGDELSAVQIHPDQYLLPSETFKEAIETVFVDYTNLVGVEINELIRNSYVANLLPFVAGLGPRKASTVLQGIQARGGTVANRTELITGQITSKVVFMNCASFFKITYDKRSIRNEETEMLDATRIHPEDYELGRKMAADALELDEEDIAAYETSGGVIAQLINEDPEKLNELILEEYADELEKKFNQKKMATLEMIKEELQNHYGEKRAPLHKLTEMKVFTLLTGDTKDTIFNGAVVPVMIRKVTDRFMIAKLSNGVEGNVAGNNITDDRGIHPSSLYSYGQTVQAVILDIDYRKFTAEISTKEHAIKDAISKLRKVRHDPKKWDVTSEENERIRSQVHEDGEKRAGRIIRHPLFRLFNSKQAEEFLAPLQRGDLVIRPSSRGNDHIAITWKISEMIYQHVDVLEIDKESEYSLGRILQVGKYRYSDLDELIIMHVQAMARKVDEMIRSDKFQKGNKAEVEKWLTAYTDANPKRSIYAFCFDHKRPGYFLLCFKTSQRSPVETWYVKVIPNGFEIRNSSYADVPSLCNGFKKMFMHKLEAVAGSYR
jgi:transcription elongation factor SPT6